MVQTKKNNAKKDKVSEPTENVGNASAQGKAKVGRTASKQHVPEVPRSAPATEQHGPKAQTPHVPNVGEGVHGGSQGGVFGQKRIQTKVKNTPHGIQPKANNSKNNPTMTSRENIMKRRREMQSKLKENPVWKI